MREEDKDMLCLLAAYPNDPALFPPVMAYIDPRMVALRRLRLMGLAADKDGWAPSEEGTRLVSEWGNDDI